MVKDDLMIKKKEPPNLFRAAEFDDVNELERAISSGLSLHAIDSNGRAPVHYASIYGSKKFIERAVALDPTISHIVDKTGRRAYEYSEQRWDTRAMDALANAMYPSGIVILRTLDP